MNISGLAVACRPEDLSVDARYNCSMCHVPQATNVKSLPSGFVREKSPEK